MPFISPEAAVAMNCFIYWAFLWDDYIDSTGGLCETCVA